MIHAGAIFKCLGCVVLLSLNSLVDVCFHKDLYRTSFYHFAGNAGLKFESNMWQKL
jgi:hypothetical protein